MHDAPKIILFLCLSYLVQEPEKMAWFWLQEFFFSIHRPIQCDEVSKRSLSLCCDLLTAVCQAALQFCDDALDCHLKVIVGTLTAQVTSQPAISQQVMFSDEKLSHIERSADKS